MTEDDLKTQVAALQARVAELEARTAPRKPIVSDYVPPPNPIDRLSMSKEVMADMAKAVPDSLIRDIVRGGRVTGPVSIVAGPSATPRPCGGGTGTGWRNAAPLGPPPGINHIDRMIEVQDAKDRARLIADEARRRSALAGPKE